MDQFILKLKNQTCLSVYRGIYSPVNSNMFVIIKDNKAIVIDPNVNNELLDILFAQEIKQVFIMLTHEHFDHLSGVAWLQEKINAILICNSVQADIISKLDKSATRLVALVLINQDKLDGGHRYDDFKNSFTQFKLKADITFNAPCEYDILNLHFRGIPTPGHSPGSWCIELDNYIFTGDCLLKDNDIILRFPESNKDIYIRETLPYLKSLSSSSIILPGHGNPFCLDEK